MVYVITAYVMTAPAMANMMPEMSARAIMEEVYRRHEQFPYIYEEQVMVLIDAAGNRDTRKLRRYSRLDSADSGRYLLLFDNPPEVRGVALLTTVDANSRIQAGIYLPAFGARLIESVGQNEADSFLGTDFSVYDLLPEPLDRYDFERLADEEIDGTGFFVIDIFDRNNRQENAPARKRHYVRKDNFYITRTDTFDRHGRIRKQQTHHDLKPLGGDMWRADMILMNNLKANHQTLVKITRRVFSRDYVHESLFTLDWLIENQHMPSTEEAATPEQQTTDGMDVSQLVPERP